MEELTTWQVTLCCELIGFLAYRDLKHGQDTDSVTGMGQRHTLTSVQKVTVLLFCRRPAIFGEY
jgi:hypothetical protein